MEPHKTSPQTFLALPDPQQKATTQFHAALTGLVRAAGGTEETPPTTPADFYAWEGRMRRQLGEALGRGVPETLFDMLVSAAVLDPDPSFNRLFVEAAMAAGGRRRVMQALIERMRTAPDYERAGAARAWYWALPSLSYRGAEAWETKTPTPESQAACDAVADLCDEWRELTLREFVRNNDLDVRRCILPGLPLRPDKHRAELAALVHAAIEIARSSPDEYLRHRVEHQVR